GRLVAVNLAGCGTATCAPLWSVPLGGGVEASSPIVVNGVVYVGVGDDKLYAISAVTHAVLWTGSLGSGILASPAYGNGIVYAASGDGFLYAFPAGPSCANPCPRLLRGQASDWID